MNKSDESDNEIPPRFRILCDMDGTLVDTDYANFLSYKRAVTEVTHGHYDVKFDTKKRLCREELRSQIPQLSDIDYESIILRKSEYFFDYLAETKLNTAVADLIIKHSKSNEVILVTNCRQKRAIETLRHHKLLAIFARLVCREALSEIEYSNKYKSALILLGTNPEEVIIVENEIGDIQKAVLAGVPIENVISLL